MNILKLNFIILLTIISCSTLYGQNTDAWTLIWNKDSTLTGYQDKNGIVKIEPKFTGFQTANKFDNIIAVTEEVDGKWKNYYLTKSGKIVGRDSLFSFDNTPDCENEGFIRFMDRKTDKIGMFNKNGQIVIPAEYNDLTNVINGLIVGLKDAEKKYWDKELHTGCNHFNWSGGKQVLLDTLNKVLVDNFALDYNLNLNSVKRTNIPNADTIRTSFLSKDGSYYSFIDFEKEFKQWLLNDLFVNLTLEKLVAASYETIIWESINGWAKTDKQIFIMNNFNRLNNGMKEIISPNCDYHISSDGLNPYMYEGEEFEKYFNNCRQAKYWIYPTMTIIISHKKTRNNLSQNHYQFLKTDNGYKLISVVIRSEKIK